MNFSYAMVVFLMLVIVFTLNQMNQARASYQVIFPSDTTLHDVTHKEWLVNWWKWWTSIPSDTHPGEKQSDAKRCAMMQNGPVWFLPDVVEGEMNYKCDIQLGNDIMLPISTTECDGGGVEGNLTDDELRGCGSNIEYVVSRISINGTNVNDTQSIQPIHTDFFNVTYPENPTKIWGSGVIVNIGTSKASAIGYFMFLRDLPTGIHSIEMDVKEKLKESRDIIHRIGHYEIFIQ